MKIIDFHTHAFPDAVAERAIASLRVAAAAHTRAYLDGRVDSLIASMDAAGIDRSVICTIATKPEQFDGILRWCLSIRGERIVPLASIHPFANDVAAQVARVAEAGLAGIKLHPMYQDFATDEPRLDPLYAAVAAAGLIVVIHCGVDFSAPASDQAHPRRVAAVLDRHPGLMLVATHLGGWKAWDAVRRHLLGRDVWMETSFSLGWMADEEALAIMRAHGVERCCFGTDSPWAEQAEQVAMFNRLPLTPAERSAIFADNADRLLERAGLSPSPSDTDSQ